MSTLGWLRRQAVGWSLPRRGGTLGSTLAELEFVQADPIQAPARAQELILRQRVAGYRVGDLDRHYPSLDVDEDFLYAYGFVARRLRRFLHPRYDRHSPDGRYVPGDLAAEVLAFVRERGVVHPRDVQVHFGHERRTNAWGGTSSSTTMELDRLRHHGLLRVADRVGGVRRYEAAAAPLGDPLNPVDRLRRLVLRVARTLAPVSEKTLSTAVSRLALWAGRPHGRPGGLPVIRDLLARGELAAVDVAGTRYVWPADLVPVDADPPARVRFLAPFDPVVWDRRRFGQLWGWEYRFEAYTPVEQRVHGYYAMPLLWRDRVIGWATCQGREVVVGYVESAPAGRSYAAALDAEIVRLRRFLAPE
ncbi:MAG: winged helix-turn-helix domain-containing protein [Micromonosporaceae bacterium]|nr:winged helix-turn-helix domain-containing protein [Micromonosporaceae bacterium]